MLFVLSYASVYFPSWYCLMSPVLTRLFSKLHSFYCPVFVNWLNTFRLVFVSWHMSSFLLSWGRNQLFLYISNNINCWKYSVTRVLNHDCFAILVIGKDHGQIWLLWPWFGGLFLLWSGHFAYLASAVTGQTVSLPWYIMKISWVTMQS